MTPAAITDIKSRIDIIALVSETVKLRNPWVGKWSKKGVCPFCHGDGDLYVSAQHRIYYCFGCHASGSAIDWVMRVKGVDFEGAVALLAYRLIDSEALRTSPFNSA